MSDKTLPTPAADRPTSNQRKSQPIGAPIGNENAIKQGIYSWRLTGRLPKRHHHLRMQLLRLGELIEADTKEALGRELNAVERKLITDTIRHEGTAQLAEKWLAKHYETLTASELTTLLSLIGRATDAGTRAMRQLGIDRADIEKQREAWRTFDGSLLPEPPAKP